MHGLDEIPTAGDLDSLQRAFKRKTRPGELAKLRMRIANGVALAMVGDVKAKNWLIEMCKDPIAKRMITKKLGKGKLAKLKVRELPSSGWSVQGGAPSLGKRK